VLGGLKRPRIRREAGQARFAWVRRNSVHRAATADALDRSSCDSRRLELDGDSLRFTRVLANLPERAKAD